MKTKLSDTYEGIMADFQSLMDKFDQKITEYGQHGRNQQIRPNTNLASELNMLKLERARVKQISIDMQTMTEGQVLDLKIAYDENYKNAYLVLTAIQRLKNKKRKLEQVCSKAKGISPDLLD